MRSRRGPARWASSEPPAAARVDVLIPTIDRPSELAVTLAGLAAQDDPTFRVVIADQSEHPVEEVPAIAAMVRLLRAQGRTVDVHRRRRRRGVAEQRRFLYDQARSELVLYLDDDVWLEPGHLLRLCDALDELHCGFVGAAVQGLSFLDDDRPVQRRPFRAWREPVEPERLRRDSPEIERASLHLAANLVHQARDLGLTDDEWVAYRIAWVGGCVLYRREVLEAVDAFGFWRDLPVEHAGEDVATQWLVMERWGGAGILPSGAVHLEARTTVPDRDVEAADVVFRSEDPGP